MSGCQIKGYCVYLLFLEIKSSFRNYLYVTQFKSLYVERRNVNDSRYWSVLTIERLHQNFYTQQVWHRSQYSSKGTIKKVYNLVWQCYSSLPRCYLTKLLFSSFTFLSFIKFSVFVLWFSIPFVLIYRPCFFGQLLTIK